MVKNYEADMFSEERRMIGGEKLNKKQYEEIKKKFSELSANTPISMDDINFYPGSSKGKSPEDDPQHYKLWLKSELS